jgi:hypothetical protein
VAALLEHLEAPVPNTATSPKPYGTVISRNP